MASNINDTGVNKDYPVAGQDNDSQGFRDNFNIIKDNFVAAKSEIETLQTNTAKLNVANDFLTNNISNCRSLFFLIFRRLSRNYQFIFSIF